MVAKERLPNALSWLAQGLLLAAAVLVAWHARHTIPDDAFIVLRVVRHWITGNGPYFNVGDSSVQAVTSPLNLLVLTLLAQATRWFGASVADAPILAAQILFLLTLPLVALLAFALVCADRRSLTPILGGFFAGMATIVVVGGSYVVGLETALVLALVLASLLAYRKERWALTSALLALAFLARHDVAILTGWMALLFALRSQAGNRLQAALTFLRPFALIVIVWIAYAMIVFGKPMPDTLAAKMAQGGTPYWPEPYWWGMRSLHTFFQDSAGGQAAFSLCLALAALSLFAGRTPGRAEIGLLFAYTLTHLIAYSLLGIPVYHWYYLSYAATLCVLAGYGIASLPGRALGAVAVSVALLLLLTTRKEPLLRDLKWEARYLPYRNAGEYLSRHPAKAVGMSEIGVIGYFAPNVRIFDFSGIATPDQRSRVASAQATAWLYEEEELPERVVIRGTKHPLEPDFDPRFETLYEKEREFRSEDGSVKVEIWRLRAP
jgi:hypothetical protein